MPPAYDCIVIGAGWAGAVAARSLASAGYKVLILEARNRIGGRAHTFTEGMHAPVDVGASFIHGYLEGNPARDIAKELGVTAKVVGPTIKAIYNRNGRLSPADADRLQNNLGAALAHAGESAQSTLLSTTPLSSALFSADSPLTSADAGAFDAADARAFARQLEVPYGAPLEALALRWYGWEDAFAGSDAAPVGGYQPLVAKVVAAAQAHGAEVALGAAVRRIERTEDGVAVDTDGAAYRARAVICTIPLGVLKDTAAGLFVPPLPRRRTETIAGVHVGVLEKLVLAYPAAWWPEAATVGAFTFLPTRAEGTETDASDPEAILNSHAIAVASFATGPDAHPTLLFYLSPSPALALALFPPDAVAAGAHRFLVSHFGAAASNAPAPSASTLTRWHADPLARGATSTPSVTGAGRGPLDFVELGKPLWAGALGFAGEHTDAEHRGSVAGAVVSGKREAERVARLLRKLDDHEGA